MNTNQIKEPVIKYTRGPWISAGAFVVTDNTQEAKAICKMAYMGQIEFAAGVCSLEDKANARLIASSPGLLEACEEALDIINSYSHIPAQFKACQILQQAITKATK